MFQKDKIICDIEGCQESMNILDPNSHGWRWYLGKYHLCVKHTKMIDEDKNYKPVFKNH
jgi:hypothetical protein